MQLYGGTERILIVDDELPIIKMQKQILQRMGYIVTAENSSEAALKTFRLAPASFDLVITDMTMPVMTGDTLALAIRDIRPEIPVILCTGFSEKVNLKTAKDLPIDGFMMKPVDKEKTEKLKRLPVIILTSSRDEGDRAMSYDNGANSYLVKPVSFDEFLKVVKTVSEYWLTLNVEPPLDWPQRCKSLRASASRRLRVKS